MKIAIFLAFIFVCGAFSRSFNIKDYGAVGDAKTDNTKAIVSAIAACKSDGGGQVVIPTGNFLTLPFDIISNMNLHLQSDSSVLLAHENPSTWPTHDCLICGTGVSNFSITGPGKIDGQGHIWWQNPSAPRPMLVVIKNCKDLLIDGPTFQNSPMFHVVPESCTNVIMRNFKILAPPSPISHNTDGIDPKEVTNMHIYNAHIDTGDDNIAIKDNTKNVVLENSFFGNGHGCSIGSVVRGDNYNITFRNITFHNTTAGVRIKTQPGCTGSVKNIVFRDFTMKDVTTIIDIDMFYSPGCGSNPTGIQIDGVTIENISGSGNHVGHFNCSKDAPCKNIKLVNINISGKDDKFVCHNAYGTETNVKPDACLMSSIWPSLTPSYPTL